MPGAGKLTNLSQAPSKNPFTAEVKTREKKWVIKQNFFKGSRLHVKLLDSKF